MWYGMMWWLVPLLIFLLIRNSRSRRRFGPGRREREYARELQSLVENQRVQIEQLEGRLVRVEEGLEFAERLLAERALPSPAAT